MTPLTAPAHIKRRGGPLWQLQQARAARAEWIAARRRDGHSLRQIADALGITVGALLGEGLRSSTSRVALVKSADRDLVRPEGRGHE